MVFAYGSFEKERYFGTLLYRLQVAEKLGIWGFMMREHFTKICMILSFLAINVSLFSAQQTQDIFKIHKDVMSELGKIEALGSHVDHEAVIHVLRMAHDIDPDYATRLKKDIKKVRLAIKQHHRRKTSDSFDKKLLKNLEYAQKFMYKYRVPLDVINYHADIQATWHDMFEAVDKGQDLLPLLAGHGITDSGAKGLKALASRFNRIKDKIEEYEYRLHADWVSLKLANYVLRIETIRVRNAAIFHPQYKGKQMESIYPR